MCLGGFCMIISKPKINICFGAFLYLRCLRKLPTFLSVFWCIVLRPLSVINQRHIEQEESINRPLDSSSKSHNSHNVQRSGFWGFQNGSSESCKIPNFSPPLLWRLSYLLTLMEAVLLAFWLPKHNNNTDQKGILPLLNCCINKQFNRFNMLCWKLLKGRIRIYN